ncbi:MAG: TRAP transporter substrate-binding protein [Deltaproteobacteria bacterium]|nr:TRAP transporter substrate-binding protein [Deltaproteobacteria bacterium]
MKKLVAGALVSFCLFPFLSPLPSYGADKVAALELASFLPPQNPLSVLLVEFAKEAERRTNGRVKITVHHGQTLVPMPQTYDSVMNEIADMGFASLSINPGRFPLMEVLDLPHGIKNARIMTQLSNSMYKKFQPKELDGVKVLFLLSHGPGIVHTKTPVRKLEDLQGLKLRCPGGFITSIVKELGGVPLVMPAPDTYDALKRGVADGVVATPDALVFLKFGEILPYTTENYGTAFESTGYVIMNKKKWNSLPADVQETMNALGEEYSDKLARRWDEMDQMAIKQYSTRTVFKLSPEEEQRWFRKIAPLYDLYVKEKSAKGLPAAEALKFCRDFARTHQQ